MSRKNLLFFFLFFLGLLSFSIRVQAQVSIVHAVLFYSPTCPHCHKVMTEDLPPLKDQFGAQLVILEVNVTQPDGQALYQTAIRTFNVPQDRHGVPALLVGNTYLVGSYEIPAWFPGIIANGLQQGGIDWPQLPGLAPFVEALELGPSESSSLTMAERFALDPVGNSLAVAVLVGLVMTVVLAGFALVNRVTLTPWPEWVIPALVGIGMIVAGYLAFVETTNTEAVCGPVGDCNTVQQSAYAHLFGVLPVGVFGLIGYAGIGIAWGVRKYASEKPARQGALIVWWMALLGTLFSIYLTFLEPFVIGASCAWCLTSAIIMALVLWASTPAAQEALIRPKRRRHHVGQV